MLGDILARSQICRATGLGNRQLKFSTSTFSKPFLVNNSMIYFIISHSVCYVVCAVADEPIGIDTEIIRPVELKSQNDFLCQAKQHING